MKFSTSYDTTPIFLINSFDCNLKCEFCLFKFNKGEDSLTGEKLVKLEQAIKLCEENNRRIKVKITGGEPLLRDLSPYLKAIDKNNKNVEFIGMGTNGTFQIPEYFNDVKTKTYIYFSWHAISEPYGLDDKLSFDIAKAFIDNPDITYRASCNLIKGEVDSLLAIKYYLELLPEEIEFVCFRELNSIDIEKNSIYEQYIYDYIEYRKEKLIPLLSILQGVNEDEDFTHVETRDYGFIRNAYYKYKNTTVLFRILDEGKLIDVADSSPDQIDEIVIHPDGLVTGCWDRDRKVMSI